MHCNKNIKVYKKFIEFHKYVKICYYKNTQTRIVEFSLEINFKLLRNITKEYEKHF